MPNAIETVSKYIPYLDQVYAKASCSSILDLADDLILPTADASTFLIAQMAMQGLGDYSRQDGFVKGDVSLNWMPMKFTKDRGRSFSIDAMDNIETLGVAFGHLASEFIRTKVAPEVDAIRFDKYASGSGHAVADAALNAENIVDAVDEGIVIMQEEEIDTENSILFITPTLYMAIKKSDKFSRVLTPGENPNRNFGKYDELTLQVVPQKRFIKGITLQDGKTAGQEAGGYIKTVADGKNINFMIVDRSAVLQSAKHAKTRVFEPDVNQSADAYKVDYRIYHDAWVKENRKKGIYAHCAPT